MFESRDRAERSPPAANTDIVFCILSQRSPAPIPESQLAHASRSRASMSGQGRFYSAGRRPASSVLPRCVIVTSDRQMALPLAMCEGGDLFGPPRLRWVSAVELGEQLRKLPTSGMVVESPDEVVARDSRHTALTRSLMTLRTMNPTRLKGPR